MDSKSQTVKPTSNSGNTKKKSSGAEQIFKVALFMLRRRRSKKPKASVDMGSDKGLWRRLLGSMRPLHIQGNEPPPTAASVDMSLASSKPKEVFKEALMPLPSPSPSPSPSSSSFSCTSRSSSFGTSQYASAANLQELDDNTEDNDENTIEDDNGGDNMIDAKAEKFIAQFYEQMRRQRQNY